VLMVRLMRPCFVLRQQSVPCGTRTIILESLMTAFLDGGLVHPLRGFFQPEAMVSTLLDTEVELLVADDDGSVFVGDTTESSGSSFL